MVRTAICIICVLVTGVARAEQRITRDDLQRVGAARLSDIVWLLDDFDSYTIDGYTWQVAPRGGGAFDSSRWRLFVDDVLVEFDLFGTTSLSALPIAVSDISEIVVEDGPVVHNGWVGEAGAIRIYTRHPRGNALSGWVSAGNETGEPGPFQLTELSTPNVERIGPDWNLGGETDRFAAGVVRQQHPAIDDRTLVRNTVAFDGDTPEIRLRGAHARVRDLRFARARFHSTVLISRLDDAFFLQPFGREIQIRRSVFHGQVTGEHGVGDWQLRAIARANRLQSKTLRNSFNLSENVDRSIAELQLSIRRIRSLMDVQFGTAGSRVDDVSAFERWRTFGSIRWRTEGHTSGQAAVHSTHVSGDHAIAVTTDVSSTLRTGLDVHIAASYTETLPRDDKRIWQLDERGLPLLSQAGVSVTRDRLLEKSRQTVASVGLGWRPVLRSWKVRADIFYRKYADLQLEQQLFVFNTIDQSASAPVNLVSRQGGEVFGGAAAINWSRERMNASLRYRWQRPTGTTLFKDHWQIHATHRARASFSFHPGKNFGTFLSVTYLDVRRWADYVRVDGDTRGEYPHRLGSVVIYRASLYQWLAQRRLRASLGVNGSDERRFRMHPLGAEFALTVVAGIEWHLGGR